MGVSWTYGIFLTAVVVVLSMLLNQSDELPLWQFCPCSKSFRRNRCELLIGSVWSYGIFGSADGGRAGGGSRRFSRLDSESGGMELDVLPGGEEGAAAQLRASVAEVETLQAQLDQAHAEIAALKERLGVQPTVAKIASAGLFDGGGGRQELSRPPQTTQRLSSSV